MSDLITALGLVLVIEGVLLAILPERLRTALTAILQHPSANLRLGGIATALLGLLVVWLVRG